MEAGLNNLIMETTGTEKEAAEILEAVQEMEVEAVRGYSVEGEEEGVEIQRVLGALEFITQDTDPSRTTLADYRNGFNKLN